MKKKEIKANILLLLTAFIWGLAFVAQRKGAEHLGALTFNGIRFLLGSMSLLPLIIIMDKKKSNNVESRSIEGHSFIKYGIIAGCALFMGSTLQQMGVAYTTAGKAGFITGLYMVIVPVFGLFLKQKTNFNTWIGITIAVCGLYLLSIKEGFTISKGDLLVLMGSFFWAIHILLLDNFTKKVDCLKLSSVQFATCGVFSIAAAFIFEKIALTGIMAAIIPILYGGLCSVGVAYTLQTIAQRDADPSVAAILLSMESVFAFLGGIIILREPIGMREFIGCILIFAAIIITQLNPEYFKRNKSNINKEEVGDSE